MNQNKSRLNIRERIFKLFFIAGDWYKVFLKWFFGFCRFIMFISLLAFILGLVFYLGFINSEENTIGLKNGFRVIFLVVFFAGIIPGIITFKWKNRISQILRLLLLLLLIIILLSNFNLINLREPLKHLFVGNFQIILGILIIGISELSVLQKVISTVKIPPGFIFSISFLLLIVIGSGLLMMPKAHSGHLSYIDSLFTSVSAVCVTGLVVVDTETAFTILGKIIIMFLIQIGGLGIMTFTGFFSFIFASGSSFRNNLVLKELFSSETMNNLFRLLAKIIMITLLTEAIGALIIYSSLDIGSRDRLLFSVFHSVSAFCNAGFSTLSGNLYTADIRYNTTLQLSVAILIILGGIGFPVLVSVYANFKHLIATIIRKLRGKQRPVKPVKKNVAVSIVLFMTFILILTGSLLYYLFESEKSLNGMDNIRKIIISFFASVSARTAGFNITEITLWSYPTIFMMIFLMWIGASPGSTGGGIKTTTFALALRTSWNFIRGKEQLRIGNREISNSTITRVLSIIFLSLILIGAGFFSLLISEPGKDPVKLLFECFSAYATAGLSIVDSTTLTSAGKIIDMILMFVGRVGPLTLLTGFLLSSRKRYSRYPEVEIVIN
jgi:potassium uptake TrkH family protein